MFRVVIPARFASARLPGKPLQMLGGKPLLQWVHEAGIASGAAETLIATDDERILAVATAFGAVARLTAATHASGTDRIAEVALQSGWADDDVVVNLQGDEPMMPPQLLRQVAALLQRHADADIATLATPISSAAVLRDPNAVKVVTDAQGRALYFSRAPIPWRRDVDDGGAGRASHPGQVAHSGQAAHPGHLAHSGQAADPDDPAGHRQPLARRHIGLYAYRVSALQRLSRLPPSPLELTEKLEQLRALECGMQIRVADAEVLPGPDVNTAGDLALAARLLAAETV